MKEQVRAHEAQFRRLEESSADTQAQLEAQLAECRRRLAEGEALDRELDGAVLRHAASTQHRGGHGGDGGRGGDGLSGGALALLGVGGEHGRAKQAVALARQLLEAERRLESCVAELEASRSEVEGLRSEVRQRLAPTLTLDHYPSFGHCSILHPIPHPYPDPLPRPLTLTPTPVTLCLCSKVGRLEGQLARSAGPSQRLVLAELDASKVSLTGERPAKLGRGESSSRGYFVDGSSAIHS